jgi:hypothetical protein
MMTWRTRSWHGLFLMRIGLGLFLADNGGWLFGRKLQGVVSRPEALFHSPLVEALHLPFPPPAPDLWGQFIALLGWMIALGIGWRVAAVVASAAIVYVGSCLSGFGYFNHGTIIIPQMLWVLVVSPGADACSLNRLAHGLWRRRHDGIDRSSLFGDWMGPSTAPWGLHLAGGLFVLIYLGAGISKLRYAPGDWLSGVTLQAYLTDMEQQYWLGPSSHVTSLVADPPIWAFSYVSPPTELGRWIAAYPTLCAVLAITTVVFELLVPIGLVLTPRLRALSCALLLSFHFAISQIMAIPFRSWVVVIAALFPWTELFRAVRGSPREERN